MTRRYRVGVVGARGAAGAAVARYVEQLGLGPVLRGRRAADGAERVVVPGAGVPDDGSLARFCRSCEVVVDGSGPAVVTGDRVLRAAVDAGAAAVSLGSPGLPAVPPGATVLLDCGQAPGLTEVLPRWLAARCPGDPVRMQRHAGGRTWLAPASAADFAAAREGVGVELVDGRRRLGARIVRGARLPYFPEPVTVLPHLGAMDERLARALGVRDARCAAVLGGPRLAAALGRPAERLCAAAAADVAEREPYQVIAVELGSADGRTVAAVLRSGDAYELTGAVAAVAAEALLQGDVPPGVHTLAEAVNAGRLLDRLRSTVPGLRLDAFDGDHAGISAPVEEGAL